MLSDADRQMLLGVARSSIRYGLDHGIALPVVMTDYSPDLQSHKASFVTLKIHDELRGCIGSLEAHRSLVEDVAQNAYAAAFRDPRFSPLTEPEYADLQYHISILTPPEPVSFSSETDLLQQLRPGIDGVVLQEGQRRGTFLPQVWESLPDPVDFLRHLKQKAGLPADYWSDRIRIERYTVEDI